MVILEPDAHERGHPNPDNVEPLQGGFRLLLLWLSMPILVVHGLAVFYGFIWLIQNLRGNQRILWLIGYFIGGSFAALVWWWRLIRLLPEPAR